MRPTACWMLALLTAGCGLRDYEDRMREAQAGAERCADEADLDVPLAPPAEGVPDLFFRPPLGQEQVKDNEPTFGATYHFERRPGAPSVVTDVFVTVRQGRPTGVAGGSEKVLRPPGREPLAFRQLDLNDSGDADYVYSQWVLQTAEPTQVTLLYRAERNRLAEAAAQIDRSARSLTVGEEGVQAARRAYDRWGKGLAKRP